ncbi:putative polypeptide N-acetylgalactosaminyltransferase 9 [Anopheles cruzii]|uniref:putative polypeptide N-acetylgalactosaminyltransferase 9 n=1 Tax=Anopheles cruzii TaxID=68878 RepID=UPI0022EC4D89|nr:putative polypeptide N-acetylgalactosaminyltransferase 9 [Anopheles cruzii]
MPKATLHFYKLYLSSLRCADRALADRPGDMGQPVRIELTNETQMLVSEGLRTLGYNQYASDLMSLRRRLPDLRAPWCRKQTPLPANLPPTSIVIVFYNEAWSVLLRTVHSILDRTPDRLIEEIVLVDDFSTAGHLKTRLDEYFMSNPKVRILRADRRLGLISAKVLGAKASTASVITFLDAHVECTEGWLEPLLSEVASNLTTIAIPTIDRIDCYTMQLDKDSAPALIGAYQWDLNFGWWHRTAMHKQYPHRYVPFDTPAMAGGLFVIDRRFFRRLGWYDEGFEMYGIENIELSIKSWMCGGRMVIVPCSRVAHIEKASHPYLNNVGKDIIFKNSVRLAEVWMDEYKQVMYDVYGIPRYFESIFGSIEDRKVLRQHAACGTFRGYIETVFPEMMNPFVTGAFRGEVRNAALPHNRCLTRVWATGQLTMDVCDGAEQQQYWTHNFYHELNNYSFCLEVADGKRTRSAVRVKRCHREELMGNQRWQHLVTTGQIRSEKNGQCLAVTKGNPVIITLQPCDSSRSNQKWIVKFVKLDVSVFRHH